MSGEAVDLSDFAGASGEMSREDMEKLMASPDTAVPVGDTQEEELSPEEIGRIELERACAGGLRIITIPAIIFLKDGRQFNADNFKAWGYSPFGVFAIGNFEDDSDDCPERYRLFNGEEVSSIELGVQAYNAAAEEEAAVTEAENGDGEQS